MNQSGATLFNQPLQLLLLLLLLFVVACCLSEPIDLGPLHLVEIKPKLAIPRTSCSDCPGSWLAEAALAPVC